jgi:chromosome segregation ATPase
MSLNYLKIVGDFQTLYKGPKTEAEKRFRYAEKASAKTKDMMKEYNEWEKLVKELTEELETEEANLKKLSFAHEKLKAAKEQMLKGKTPDRRTFKWLRNLLTSKTKKYEKYDKQVKERQKFADEMNATKRALQTLEREMKRAEFRKKILINNIDAEIAAFQEFYDGKVNPAFEKYRKMVELYNDANLSLFEPGPENAKRRFENAQGVVRT